MAFVFKVTEDSKIRYCVVRLSETYQFMSEIKDYTDFKKLGDYDIKPGTYSLEEIREKFSELGKSYRAKETIIKEKIQKLKKLEQILDSEAE